MSRITHTPNFAAAQAAAPSAFSLRLDKSASIPIYQQIVDGIKDAIAEGRLQAGDALPPIRAMAADLGVNQMTVSKAYKVLADQNVATGRSGGGTRVSGRPVTAPPTRAPAPAADTYFMRMSELAAAPGVIAFTEAYPPFSAGDLADFKRCIDEVLVSLGTLLFSYGPPAGNADLRKELARLIQPGPGRLDAEQIIVTSGAQQALDLCARHLLQPGDAVAVESPCYFGALEVFRNLKLNIVELPVGPKGVDPAALIEAGRKQRVRAFYTIPTVHNPTGITTPASRRSELAVAARKHDIAIIEDDYSPELFYGDKPPQSYFAAHQDTDVYYLRSLGKAYLPGTRLGCLVPPAHAFQRILQIKRATDMHSPVFVQAAAALYLRGKITSHGNSQLKMAMQRRGSLMFDALETQLPERCAVQRITGGLSFWIALPFAVSDEDLYFSAIRHSIAFAPGSAFAVTPDGMSNGLRVSFGSLSDEEIVEGCARLARALRAVLDPVSATSGSFV